MYHRRSAAQRQHAVDLLVGPALLRLCLQEVKKKNCIRGLLSPPQVWRCDVVLPSDSCESAVHQGWCVYVLCGNTTTTRKPCRVLAADESLQVGCRRLLQGGTQDRVEVRSSAATVIIRHKQGFVWVQVAAEGGGGL